mmetsp:Transcript_19842/g.38455  ORF Transcript_19842/g.38455 Transcript_19842/m.38455 type:complete len:207 (+) Transcript_19842:1774-2394(+)
MYTTCHATVAIISSNTRFLKSMDVVFRACRLPQFLLDLQLRGRLVWRVSRLLLIMTTKLICRFVVLVDPCGDGDRVRVRWFTCLKSAKKSLERCLEGSASRKQQLNQCPWRCSRIVFSTSTCRERRRRTRASRNSGGRDRHLSECYGLCNYSGSIGICCCQCSWWWRWGLTIIIDLMCFDGLTKRTDPIPFVYDRWAIYGIEDESP